MDQETKEFIESQNKALLEDVVGVIQNMGLMVEKRFNAVDARFVSINAKIVAIDARFDDMDARFDQMEAELKSVKETVERIDDRTQRQVDAVYEDAHKNTNAIEAVQTDIVRIKGV